MDGGGDSSSVRFAQGNEKENLVVFFFSFYKSPAWFGFHLGRCSQRDIPLTYRKCFSLKQHSGANQLTYCLEKKNFISGRDVEKIYNWKFWYWENVTGTIYIIIYRYNNTWSIFSLHHSSLPSTKEKILTKLFKRPVLFLYFLFKRSRWWPVSSSFSVDLCDQFF